MRDCHDGYFLLSDSIRQRVARVDEQMTHGDSNELRQLKQLRLHRRGRQLAEGLLLDLGALDVFVGVAADRSPQWPSGYVGSITHTSQWVGVAVAPAHVVRSIGVDIEAILEPHVAAEIARACVSSAEALLGEEAGLTPELLVSICFSAKEALFKCLYPIVLEQFEFHDVDLVGVDTAMERMRFRLARDLSAEFRAGYTIDGRFRLVDRHVLTSVELPVELASC